MPASTDPHNTFEVTVPPVLGQHQPFEFTFRPACPGPVTLRISMGPPTSSPVPTPASNPSTHQHVSVGVSASHVQRTPPRTLISRGCSPIPTLDLPPEIAAFFDSTQMQLQATQESEPVFSPIRPQDPEVISLTSSGSPDSERPFSKSRTRACSPTIVPETQLMRCFTMDCMSTPSFGKAGELARKRRKLHKGL